MFTLTLTPSRIGTEAGMEGKPSLANYDLLRWRAELPEYLIVAVPLPLVERSYTRPGLSSMQPRLAVTTHRRDWLKEIVRRSTIGTINSLLPPTKGADAQVFSRSSFIWLSTSNYICYIDFCLIGLLYITRWNLN